MAVYDALSNKELIFIAENHKTKSIREISKVLGRSYSAIQKAMTALGFYTYHVWTPEEDNFLIENYKKLTAAQIAEVLGLEYKVCIYNRIRRLRKNGRFGDNRSNAQGV